MIRLIKTRDEIEKDCCIWAEEIKRDYQPDLIVFVAKSGFLFAQPLAKVFNCDMADIGASRAKTESKDKSKKLIRLIPKRVLAFILSSRMMYKFNEDRKERNIEVLPSLTKYLDKSVNRILLVDDSIDTGWTIIAVKEKLFQLFPKTEIKIASYSVIDISKKRVKVDFGRYENAVILTATSRRSEEYEKFLNDYERWFEQQV